jgi:predicted MPP superfamily phosphohydrolase
MVRAVLRLVASKQGRTSRFLRAKVRHALITRTADTLTLGSLVRRHARQAIVLRELEIHAGGWPRAFNGLRIAHVTDFHVGHLMPADRAVEAIERLGALRPDLLACTGDVVDLECRGVEPVLAALGAVPAPLGRFLVLGNHDHLDDGGLLAGMARMRGLEVLHGEVATVRDARGALRVGGVDWSRTPAALRRSVGLLRETPHLLLAHNPKAFPAAAARGVALTLSGHTHGGQVALARRPRANLHVGGRLSAGIYHRRGRALFISVGAGAWFPVRVNCPPEVVLLTVRAG